MKTTSKNYKRNRIAIYKSNQHIYAQIIDDTKGITLVSASDYDLVKSKKTVKSAGKKTEEKGDSALVVNKKLDIAMQVGELLAKKAIEKKISEIYFDRRHYRYHGRVKALADGVRKGGLVF